MPDPAPAADRRFAFAVGAILAAAAIVRVVLIFQMGSRYYFADTGEYEAAARSILAGHGPGAAIPRAPLYPALMALGFFLFGDGNLTAVRMVQLAVGLSVVALTMRLGHVIAGRQGAVVAGLGAAFAPTLVFTTGMLYPTALYAALLLAATLIARDLDRRPGLLRGALLGLVILLAWLTDPVAAVPGLAILT
ncbi:MAG TPA: glycosyltransferase family 39 protein, partial [Candidatus Eisenbacteria bacterium]